MSKWLPRQACIVALGLLLGALTIYWLHFDHSLHADSRYYLRTALVLAIPLLGALATITAMIREGIDLELAEPLARPDLATRPCAMRPRLDIHRRDHDSPGRNREIRRVLGRLSRCCGRSGDERSIRSEARRSSFRLGRADSASARGAVVVLDRPLSVDHSFKFLAEPARHRSRRKLLLAIVRDSDEKQGCSACRSGAGARTGTGLFVPASIRPRRETILKLIIFDFDGTLVDSRSLIWESHRIVFAEFQLPVPSPANSLALVGKSLNVILTELAGPTAPIPEMVRAYDLLLPQLRADPAFAERPFDGVGDLLHELSSTTGYHSWPCDRTQVRHRGSRAGRAAMERPFSNHSGGRHGAFKTAPRHAPPGDGGDRGDAQRHDLHRRHDV